MMSENWICMDCVDVIFNDAGNIDDHYYSAQEADEVFMLIQEKLKHFNVNIELGDRNKNIRDPESPCECCERYVVDELTHVVRKQQ